MTAVENHVEPKARAATGKARGVLAAAMLLLVVVNALYAFWSPDAGSALTTESTSLGGKPERIFDMEPRSAIALLESGLVRLQDRNAVNRYEAEGTVSGIAPSSDKTKVYVGTSDGAVRVLDRELRPIASFEVQGRVAAIDASAPGQFVVAHGVGQFTGKFWLSAFDEKGNNLYRQSIGFDVNAIAVGPKGTYYGTEDSVVGLLSADGKELWRTTLLKPIKRLAAVSGGRVVAGDEEGNVALLADSGRKLWQKKLSAGAITLVGGLPSPHKGLLVGDSNANLYVLSEQGDILYRTKLSDAAIPDPVTDKEGRLGVMSADGKLALLSIARMTDAGGAAWLKPAWLALNALLALVLLASLIAAVPSWRARMANAAGRIRRSRKAYAMILPSLLLIMLFKYIPVGMAVLYSFTNFSLDEPLRWIGFANFSRAFHDKLFLGGLGNLLLIVVTSLMKELTMPLLAAELIFWLRSRKQQYGFRILFVLPAVVPAIVTMLLWKMIYNPDTGLINMLLAAFGLEQWQHAWLAEERLAIWSIVFAGFPFITIFSFLVYYGGLINISQDIFDAASIDGMTGWRRFWTVDIPMIGAQIRLVLFFAFVGSVQGFANIYIYTRGGPGSATYVPGLQMYDKISTGEFGYASALGVVLALLIVVAVFVNQKFSRNEVRL